MRTEKEILAALMAWAAADENIQALLLTGSRANEWATVDLLSDFDVEVVVNDIDSFRDNRWLPTFGEVMAIFSEAKANGLTRLVLYKDGTRIDFQLCGVEELNRKILRPPTDNDWDIGVRVLVDKRGITSKIKSPSHVRYTITMPSQEEYTGLIKDFWWDSTYVAKSLWRDEVYYAKYMLDSVIRFGYLKTAIEWYIGMNNGWNVNTNKQGRWFKQYLDTGLWMRIESTFAGAGAEENWAALFAMTSLFGDVTREIGNQLKYDCPGDLMRDVTNYLETIKKLEHEPASGRT